MVFDFHTAAGEKVHQGGQGFAFALRAGGNNSHEIAQTGLASIDFVIRVFHDNDDVRWQFVFPNAGRRMPRGRSGKAVRLGQVALRTGSGLRASAPSRVGCGRSHR